MHIKKHKLNIIYLILLLITILVSGCDKGTDEENTDEANLPKLTTTPINEITHSTAKSGGSIVFAGSAIKALGCCWSTSKTPTISDFRTTDSLGALSFNSYLTGLAANTTYYARAYATNLTGTGYGNVIAFTTLSAPPEKPIDQDGHTFDTVKIGSQVWMKENLRVTHYQNGDAIQNVTDNSKWSKLTTGAYCNYNNDVNNSKIYGRLYSWKAVKDNRKICPKGWHVPSDSEWWALVDNLGGDKIAGGRLKSTGTSHWKNPNLGATNASGFTALPGGYRYQDGVFLSLNYGGGWWTSTEAISTNGWYRYLFYDDIGVTRSYYNDKLAFSVRCVKD